MIRPHKDGNKNFLVFLLYWAILFILYLPAAKAGRVGDFPGWVNALTSRSFMDYVNRKGSGIPSLYQFTQVVSYFFYQLFGANAWLWHLLYITLQALNAWLLFVFFKRLLSGALTDNGVKISFTGALLFCLCPHISEVVVWEPSFHYLLGLLLMLAVLLCTQKFMNTQSAKYAWLGGIIFFLSTYSLEVFYLTPLFVALLVIFYSFTLNYGKAVLKKSLLYFTLPQVILFLVHLSVLQAIYHESVAHIGTVAIQLNTVNLSKLPKYIFHILFFGRFFPDAIRAKVYHFCESGVVLSFVYSLLALTFIYIAARYRQMKKNGKAAMLLFAWALLSLILILPLWFPDTGVVIYDRYTYVADAFIYMFLSLWLHNIFGKKVYLVIIALYALLNIRYTHRVNAYWQQSAQIVNKLVSTFPNDTSKKVLLLDLPECLDGVQMVGTRDDGEFRMMYNAIMPKKITNPVYDVEAFYLKNITDGAHVMVINDSVLHVTLNQWGTWWLYYGYGATSYENADFKVNMIDEGHWYELTLKHPAIEYLLLYSVGDTWNTVDWSKKNVEQY